ncbi:MAG: aspartate carbamoyltransferase catalytic subunit, partial [Dongiaceae bacterium]
MTIKHFLSTKNLSKAEISALLNAADNFAKKNPPPKVGKTIGTLFFEDSTRTKLSFEMAALRLGIHPLSLNVATSSVQKGETVLDTAQALAAMGINALVVRHQESGLPEFLSKNLPCAVINAGDGINEHPTQALLDALTIRQHKGKIEGLKIAICGDIKHSRVARSNLHLLKTMGAEIVLCGPPALLPANMEVKAPLIPSLEEAIKDADVIMGLRIQKERMEKAAIPSGDWYFQHYGLTHEKIKGAKPDV